MDFSPRSKVQRLKHTKPLFKSVGEAVKVDGPTKLLCTELIRETSCQS